MYELPHFCCRFWLTIAPKVHLPFRLGIFSLLSFLGCDFCEQSFLGPLRQCLLTLPRYELRTSFETIFSRLLHVWTEPFRLIDFFFPFGYADFRRFDVFMLDFFSSIRLRTALNNWTRPLPVVDKLLLWMARLAVELG